MLLIFLDKYTFQNWHTAEPNGDVKENCVATTRSIKGEIKWLDIPCDFKRCTLCDIPKVPVFQIRGNKSNLNQYSINT